MARRLTIARRTFSAAFVILAAAAVFLWSVKREIPFDPQRWKNPSWVTDRSRMLPDLFRVLEARKRSRDELLAMLEGEPERRDPYRAQLLAEPHLVYGVPKPSPYWPWNRTVNNLELHLYVGTDGRYRDCEVQSDNSD
jgi:hypothetical protein